MRTSALFSGAENFGFIEIYGGVRTDKGVEPVRSSWVNFLRTLLWTAVYLYFVAKHMFRTYEIFLQQLSKFMFRHPLKYVCHRNATAKRT